jgi:hypothetical protein
MQNRLPGRRPQNRLPADQRLQMIQQFRRSGLTGAAFSRRYGIPLSTLKWWLKKERHASNLPAPIIFGEVRLEAPENAPRSGWAMEISAPSGWTIRCREAMSAEDLARLMRRGRC